MKTKVLFKCVTDIETYIISSENISLLKTIISQDGMAYIRVDYFDDELCIYSSIYCTNVEKIN